VIITIVLACISALILSRFFALTPQGLKRDEEVKPNRSNAPQTARHISRMIIAVLVLALGYFVFDKFVLAPRKAAPPKPISNRAEPTSNREGLTSNREAYDAYLRGVTYSKRQVYDPNDVLSAIKYLAHAVELDPNFAAAWAYLAWEDGLAFFNKLGDDVPALSAAARHAAQRAVELQPDLAQTHLAVGYVHYYCDADYEAAISSFEKARRLAPDVSEIPLALGLACRRKGEWQRSVEHFQEAVQLDPLNISLLSNQMTGLAWLRRYPEAIKACDRILEISPGNSDALAAKATIYQSEGNLPAAAALLSGLNADANEAAFYRQLNQATWERRYPDGIAMVETRLAKANATANPTKQQWITWDKAKLAWLQQISGDASAARVTWQEVKAELEHLRSEKQENFVSQPQLASAYAALGDKAEAFAVIKEYGLSKDAKVGISFHENMASIAARAGEKELALEELAICRQNPIGIEVTYGSLTLDPLWDPLRGDPRFEKILASLAPKDTKQ